MDDAPPPSLVGTRQKMDLRTRNLIFQATNNRTGENDITNRTETNEQEFRQGLIFSTTNLVKFAACKSSTRIFTSTPKNMQLTAKHLLPRQSQMVWPGCLLPNIDSSSVEGLKALAAEYPDYCLPMMGLHPCYVKDNFEEELALVEKELRTGNYIAVGEIGMDKYWELDHLPQQEEALRRQLRWAHELDLPVALHTRNANDEVIAIIRELNLPGLRGVFHCFSGTVEQANEMIQLGFYLGIGGVLTYKNGGLDKDHHRNSARTSRSGNRRTLSLTGTLQREKKSARLYPLRRRKARRHQEPDATQSSRHHH
jgi:TatD family hydrolase